MMTIARMDKERTVKRTRKCSRIAVRRNGKRRLRWEVDGANLGKMKIQKRRRQRSMEDNCSAG
jgi:hypothetical protein